MVNGRAAASEEKRIDLSEEIAWFGDILNIDEPLVEIGSRSVLTIRRSVSGSSQRGKVLGGSGEWREISGQWHEYSDQWPVASEIKEAETTVIEKRQNKANLPTVLTIGRL
jgi:hypothetical protein